jgi:hypothetical protein
MPAQTTKVQLDAQAVFSQAHQHQAHGAERHDATEGTPRETALPQYLKSSAAASTTEC